MISKYLWLIKIIAVVVAVLGAYWWAHGRGYRQGDQAARDDLAPVIAKANKDKERAFNERDAALTANDALADQAQACTTAVTALEDAGRMREASAKAAVARAEAEASRHRSDAQWLADLRLREQADQSCDAGLKIVRERLAR